MTARDYENDHYARETDYKKYENKKYYFLDYWH